MRRVIFVIAALAAVSGCAVGKPLGKLFSDGVHDYCSHSEPHKMLFMDEVNEAAAPNSIAISCVQPGVNH